MPKRISAAERNAVRIVLVTMDSHLSSATQRAADRLRRETPGASLEIHAADEWGSDTGALDRCREAIARGDIVVVTMLFMEDHYLPLLEALRARRERCDALICAMCAGEVVRLTRMGRFVMDGSSGGPLALLKRLRGGKKKTAAAGAEQMKM